MLFVLCGRREHGTVPDIVKMCVEEVERRGMEEIGIYRVSGVASEVKELKTYFDTSKPPPSLVARCPFLGYSFDCRRISRSDRKDVSLLMSNVDINAVAGVLKLYFRELPEPLFTDRKYRWVYRSAYGFRSRLSWAYNTYFVTYLVIATCTWVQIYIVATSTWVPTMTKWLRLLSTFLLGRLILA